MNCWYVEMFCLHSCESVYSGEMLPVKGVKRWRDCVIIVLCICVWVSVCCLRTVILLSPCHLTLNATSPSPPSICPSCCHKVWQGGLEPETCARRSVCVCVFVVFTHDPHFFQHRAPRRMGGFQVMCASVCVSVSLQRYHLCSAESRLPVDYRCHHLRGMQLSLSCSSFWSLKCDRDTNTQSGICRAGLVVREDAILDPFWGMK